MTDPHELKPPADDPGRTPNDRSPAKDAASQPANDAASQFAANKFIAAKSTGNKVTGYTKKKVIGQKRGVIGIIQRDEYFLVIRRSRFVTAPMKLCLPGGTVEPGEAEEETLVREMQEELNIDVSPGSCVYRSRTPWGTLLAWWTAHLDPSATPLANAEEVDSWAWMTIEEITQVRDALPSLPEFFTAVREGRVTL